MRNGLPWILCGSFTLVVFLLATGNEATAKKNLVQRIKDLETKVGELETALGTKATTKTLNEKISGLDGTLKDQEIIYRTFDKAVKKDSDRTWEGTHSFGHDVLAAWPEIIGATDVNHGTITHKTKYDSRLKKNKFSWEVDNEKDKKTFHLRWHVLLKKPV